jgi:hypothetical protein
MTSTRPIAAARDSTVVPRQVGTGLAGEAHGGHPRQHGGDRPHPSESYLSGPTYRADTIASIDGGIE